MKLLLQSSTACRTIEKTEDMIEKLTNYNIDGSKTQVSEDEKDALKDDIQGLTGTSTLKSDGGNLIYTGFMLDGNPIWFGRVTYDGISSMAAPIKKVGASRCAATETACYVSTWISRTVAFKNECRGRTNEPLPEFEWACSACRSVHSMYMSPDRTLIKIKGETCLKGIRQMHFIVKEMNAQQQPKRISCSQSLPMHRISHTITVKYSTTPFSTADVVSICLGAVQLLHISGTLMSCYCGGKTFIRLIAHKLGVSRQSLTLITHAAEASTGEVHTTGGYTR